MGIDTKFIAKCKDENLEEEQKKSCTKKFLEYTKFSEIFNVFKQKVPNK